VYVDGCRFLPDNVTITRVTMELLLNAETVLIVIIINIVIIIIGIICGDYYSQQLLHRTMHRAYLKIIRSKTVTCLATAI